MSVRVSSTRVVYTVEESVGGTGGIPCDVGRVGQGEGRRDDPRYSNRQLKKRTEGNLVLRFLPPEANEW